jgi:arginine utilization protein RocB
MSPSYEPSSVIYFRPLHVPQDNPAVDSSAIQHFYDKLLKIKDRLKTETGKRLGAQRHQIVSLISFNIVSIWLQGTKLQRVLDASIS